MMALPALALAVVLAPAVAAISPRLPEEEMVRPDPYAPMPPTAPSPMAAVTPPDLLPPVVPERVWRAQQRKLKIQAGVSWAFTAIGLVGTAVPLAVLGACPEDWRGSYYSNCPDRRGAMIAAPIFAALAVASLIPAAIYTDRLIYRRPPRRAPQLGVTPGGLMLRF